MINFKRILTSAFLDGHHAEHWRKSVLSLNVEKSDILKTNNFGASEMILSQQDTKFALKKFSHEVVDLDAKNNALREDIAWHWVGLFLMTIIAVAGWVL